MLTMTINTFNHGRDINGNGIAHYRCQLWDGEVCIKTVLSCEKPRKRQQVGYSGYNDAAVYELEKLGYKLDLSKASSYDYQGFVEYPVISTPETTKEAN